MFRFICNKVFLKQDINKYPSLIRFLSNYPINPNSFRVSYLINSCGLSEEKAISVSEKVQFQTPTKPDLVLNLFKNHDFPDTHISKIIEKLPKLLQYDVDKTLKPKLEYFQSLGLSGPDLAKVLSSDPLPLSISLEEQIKPSVDYLKSILQTDSNVVSVLKRSVWVLMEKTQKSLAPNIEVLQSHGVPDSNISKLLVTHPRSFLRSVQRFKEIVEEVKKMEADPTKYVFCKMFQRLASMSESSKEVKFGVFKKWGWSDDMILSVFKACPDCFAFSESTLMMKMDFLVHKMGCDPLLIAKNPEVLTYSMEKKLVPRYSVIQTLMSNGLVPKDLNKARLLTLSNQGFLEKFVTKFENEVPELVNVYQGK
ncbi:hypothetical protein IFM89_004148 [Coptis chinensis]|uniref:Uncharacterized protein n=1 Tax=Coptis chinensis TaxID=261450 RepID=A0A835H3A8_9MAGN|nr:hypothetical protein IFM89_004148 [Coptis chinensis]